MSLDRKTAERRRFARLLGTDGDRGSGLPVVGTDTDSEAVDRDEAERQMDGRDGDDEAEGASNRRPR